MRRISRPTEPPELAAFRSANPDATWDEARHEHVNESVFDALAGAQGCLCAYCEIDISRPGYGQVDHWVPKSHSTASNNLHLEFGNMLAGCEGGANPSLDKPGAARTHPPIKRTLHCGQLKDDADPRGRVLDPTREVPSRPLLWSVDSQGRIRADERACGAAGVSLEVAARTVEELGLDRAGLRIRRSEVVRKLDDDLLELVGETDDDGVWDGARLRIAQTMLLPDGGRLLPFWSTIRDWAGPAIEPFLDAHAREIPGLS